jgi:hypothetical protein
LQHDVDLPNEAVATEVVIPTRTAAVERAAVVKRHTQTPDVGGAFYGQARDERE